MKDAKAFSSTMWTLAGVAIFIGACLLLAAAIG